jgi:hypothetical protein
MTASSSSLARALRLVEREAVLGFGENAHTFFICRCDSLQKSWTACTGTVRIEKHMNQCWRNNGSGRAQQVYDAIEPSPYSVRKVENTLDEMALAEQDESEKLNVFLWLRF